MKDKISIIVPVYNVEQWVKRCLESLLKQTYDNIEIIVVNDGSTDGSYEICKQIANLDDKIKLFSKENGGLSDARNYGLRRATGEYVAFVDSDDYVSSNYIKELYYAIKSKDAEISFCNYVLKDENDEFIEKEDLSYYMKDVDSNLISGRDFLKKLYIYGNKKNVVVWNKLYKRKLFDNVQFKKNVNFEDEYIIARLFYKVETITFVNKTLYDYIQRKGSITSSPYTLKKIKDANNVELSRIRYFDRLNDQELYDLAIQDYKDWIVYINSLYAFNRQINVYFQNQFRYLVELKKGNTKLQKFKDIVGYRNLRALCWCRKIYIKVK